MFRARAARCSKQWPSSSMINTSNFRLDAIHRKSSCVAAPVLYEGERPIAYDFVKARLVFISRTRSTTWCEYLLRGLRTS